MLYFALLILFIVLIVGPVIVRNYITNLPTIPLDLVQPTGQNNNDTSSQITGSALHNFGQGAAATGGGSGGGATAPAASSASSGSDPFTFGGGGGRFFRW